MARATAWHGWSADMGTGTVLPDGDDDDRRPLDSSLIYPDTASVVQLRVTAHRGI